MVVGSDSMCVDRKAEVVESMEGDQPIKVLIWVYARHVSCSRGSLWFKIVLMLSHWTRVCSELNT
jgi:hypothetical protein